MTLHRTRWGGTLALCLLTAPIAATAATPMMYDPLEGMTPQQWVQHDIQLKDGVVNAVGSIYGFDVSVMGDTSPGDRLTSQLNEGQPLPADANPKPLSARLMGLMPEPDPGAQWARVGDSVVMISANGRVLHEVLDVLP